MSATYDIIGADYANLRKADPRIGRHIHAALGNARTVLNVGAGAGNYEPTDRVVTAVEPSAEMIAQRPPHLRPAVQASADSLPFEDKSFDASMAILTIHHWPDKAKGLAEIRRVTRGPIVLLTFDPSHRGCWLTDYLPALVTLDEGQMPGIDEYQNWLGPVSVSTVPVPHDCSDGFLYAYWRRPRAYLDPIIRKGMSSFWKIEGTEAALEQLTIDLNSGAWAEQHADILKLQELDVGYRLVISNG
ncbi:class I SAM-dependent methyltransferase [Sphingorhabdus pulchriflava]|uniref:Class I SAM-dependent methyltransferase n=1 Tax=Sphingorhabdus pulchriflava TaxID=2292257 RepID=A0A371BGM0_9SPHN|nr:class I SAM-dependent methyltransferase [Sphingorhabdus pulchriflava]RDV06744.1 class I SAM-dependent methyltransferase [Sphingorhabdus pulchriflava]